MARESRQEPARALRAPEPPAPERRQLVFRRCQVCEWEGESIETSDADPECPWCHAPTVRVDEAAGARDPGQKNPFAAALGRLGGLKGGRARAARLSARRRREIAQKAARARWRKK